MRTYKLLLRFLLIYISTFCTVGYSLAQPEVEWEKSFGGSEWDWPQRILSLPNGDFIVIGNSESSDGDVGMNRGRGDGWIFKSDAEGNILWSKTFGGILSEVFYDVEVDRDGGYLLCGGSISRGIALPSNFFDYWLIKLDSEGEFLWEKKFGGDSGDIPYDLKLTHDGGYIISGESLSLIGGRTSHSNIYDVYIVKLDSNFEIEWDKSYGEHRWDTGLEIMDIPGMGYIVLGFHWVRNRDAPDERSYLVMGLDENGEVIWEKEFPTYEDLRDMAIERTNNNTVLIGGTNLEQDFWVFEMNYDGDILWEQTYGGSNREVLYDIEKTLDGGYLIGGESHSSDGDVTTNYGDRDSWLIKIDSQGNLLWEKTMGGSQIDNVTGIETIDHDCFLISNVTFSSDHDVSTNNGKADYWIVKLCDSIPDCNVQDDFLIELNAPDVSCLNDGLEILTSSNFPLDSIRWKSPSNETFDEENIMITQPGEYKLIGNSGNCVDTATIQIDDLVPELSRTYEICEGEFVEINNTMYDLPGSYVAMISSEDDCDTILNFDLNVMEWNVDSLEVEICEGEDYLGYSTTGEFRDTLINQNSCDEIRILFLEVKPEINTSISKTICYNQSYEGYTQDGTYVDIMQSSNGCDSIRELILEVSSEIIVDDRKILCPGETYEFNQEVLDKPGEYRFTFLGDRGCDSTVILTLDYFPNQEFLGEDISICSGEDYVIRSLYDETIWDDNTMGNNIMVNETGEYVARAVDPNGCLVIDTIQVQFDNQFYLPNIISPNDDGVNDFFRPYFSDGFSDRLIGFELGVFDRWGNQLYLTTEYEDVTSFGWDGSLDSNQGEQSVFVYNLKIETENCLISTTGEFIIVR